MFFGTSNICDECAIGACRLAHRHVFDAVARDFWTITTSKVFIAKLSLLPLCRVLEERVTRNGLVVRVFCSQVRRAVDVSKKGGVVDTASLAQRRNDSHASESRRS